MGPTSLGKGAAFSSDAAHIVWRWQVVKVTLRVIRFHREFRKRLTPLLPEQYRRRKTTLGRSPAQRNARANKAAKMVPKISAKRLIRDSWGE